MLLERTATFEYLENSNLRNYFMDMDSELNFFPVLLLNIFEAITN